MSCRKVRDLCGKCGILTGATSGVGSALAKLLAERGARLVISGRRESRPSTCLGVPRLLIPLPGDITKSEFRKNLLKRQGGIWWDRFSYSRSRSRSCGSFQSRL